MLKNYLKIGFRNILRFKLYSFVNIAGLSVGIASFVLIFSYVYNEITYDTFHKNATNIYRIYTVLKSPGNKTETYLANAPDPLTRALQNDYPRQIKVARFFIWQFWVTNNDKAFKEFVYFSDPSFFDMFSFKLIEGDRSSALSNPNSVVITKEFAEKIFGYKNPMGKTLKMNNLDFMVTGVLENFPVNSSIKFDVLMPAQIRERFDPGYENKWYSIGTYTFVSFSGGMTPDEFRRQLPMIVKKYEPQFMQKDAGIKLGLEPLTMIHLDSGFEPNDSMVPPSSMTFLFVLMAVAILILLISCVNFMNISVSRLSERAREIGMRKVLGAQRSQISRQFLCESLLMSFISLVIGIGLAELFLTPFRTLTGKQIDIFPIFTAQNIFAAAGFGILVGLIAGSYPAFFLSTYKPIHILSKQTLSAKKTTAKNILVVSQFVIAAILITSVFLIRRQVSFMERYNMGLKPDDVVAISTENETMINHHIENVNAYANLINAEKGGNGILSAAVSENIPGYYFNNTFSIIPERADNKQSIQMVVSSMDENFIDTYKIKFIEGRNFSLERGTDKFDAVIINQSAAKVLGWKNPAGKVLSYNGEHHTVIGVMKDINIASLQSAIPPMVYRYAWGAYERSFISVRLDPLHVAEGIKFLKDNWNKMFPNSPFEYFFVKDKYDASYEPDEKTEKIIEVFSVLAIFLAGLGLFGLSSLKVAQRTKEIGVRKVLGATISDILKLFTKEFLLLVLAGNIVAVPISYFVLSKWLQDFAYRTNIGFGIFVVTAILTLLIAFVTVSLQAIRAATANPVKSLKYE